MVDRRVVLVTALVLLTTGLTPAVADARDEGVDAGSLRARISANPWRISFTDAAGRSVLNERALSGLGFRTLLGWHRATKVTTVRRDGDTVIAELATDDPLRRRIEARVRPDAEGVIALTARVAGATHGVISVGMGFEARRDERYLGFGRRSNKVDQRGETVENYVSDGPFPVAARALIGAAAHLGGLGLIPPQGFREHEDSTYYPVPWLLSTRGYGVLVDNDETSYFKLGDRDGWRAEVVRAPFGENGESALPYPTVLKLRVFGGPTPAQVLRRFTAATGRQPAVGAPWFLGPWVQADNERLTALRRADAPMSVAQTYGHYLPGGVDRDGERRRTADLHARGLAVTTYFNPMVMEDYTKVYGQGVATDAFTRDLHGRPATYQYTTTPPYGRRVSQFDFGSPAGRTLWDTLLGQAVEDGHDGWMEDFGEYTPLDSDTSHNAYPRSYHCAAQSFADRSGRPLARFVRSGWTGSAACSPVVWGGDPVTGWGFDGLRSAVTEGLTMGLSGVGLWGSDIGGFHSLFGEGLTSELLARWVQFGAVSGVMRTESDGVVLAAPERAQIWDAGSLANWRRYAKLRTQLYPYLNAAMAEYRATGMPLMRHLSLVVPGDGGAVSRDDEFLFGPDLLAAPVVDEGARARRLYVPGGQWVDLWRTASYDAGDGGLRLGAAAMVRGGREATLPAPVDQLPLLVRAGAILPLLPPDVGTLYGLRDTRRAVLAFPRGSSTSADGTLVSAEGNAVWSLSVRGDVTRSYTLQASMRTLLRPFVPCAVTLDGRKVPWRHDPATGVVTAEFTTGSGTLEVTSCA